MKPPRRSTRSKNSLFSSTEWNLDDQHWTSKPKRLRKTAKKTCTQDLSDKPSHGRTEGQDHTKHEIPGAGYKNNTEGSITSDDKSVGYHSITVGNCGNMNKRNANKEKTQLSKLKKAGKNETEIDVNSNMAAYKKMKRLNEDSNIINEKMDQRQESGALIGENGSVTERTTLQSIQDSLGNTLKASNAFRGPFTEVQVLKNNPEFQLSPIISVKTEVETESGEADMRSKASYASDMENSSEMILDMPSAMPSLEAHSTDHFSFQPRQNVTVDRPRPSVIMKTSRATIIRDGPHDLEIIGMDVPQHIIGMDHDYAKIASHLRNAAGVGLASGRVDTPMMNLTAETAEAREAVSSEEGMQLGVATEGEHRAGLGESMQLGEAREGELSAGIQGLPRVDDQVAARGARGSHSEEVNRMEIELSTNQFIQVAGGSRSGGVIRVENNAQVAAVGAVGSRSGGRNYVVNNNAQVAAGGAGGSRSGGVNHAGGADGSQLEGGNHSVENNTPAQGVNRGARGNCGACSRNDKLKIKMEIELSTNQFIQVAHVLPLLGSSANTE